MAIYSFIAEEQADNDAGTGCGWSISEMCRTLDVSRSGFHDWVDREPSTRAVTDAMLATEIEAIWECSDRTYGAPRIHRWLRKQGFWVGCKRVARIMAINGWEGETGRRKIRTTIVDRGPTAAADHVRRDFNPTAPNVTWASAVRWCGSGERDGKAYVRNQRLKASQAETTSSNLTDLGWVATRTHTMMCGELQGWLMSPARRPR